MNNISQEQFTYETYNCFLDKEDIEYSPSEIDFHEDDEEVYNPYW